MCEKRPKIKDVNNPENQNKRRLAYVEGLVSIVVNTVLFALKYWQLNQKQFRPSISVLFALKYWAGIVSGSIALVADAWHTLSDSLSSVIVIVGTKLSGKRANKKHPFGYGRWQQISAIFVGVLLSIVAYEFAKESIIKFSNKEAASFGTIAIVVGLPGCERLLVLRFLSMHP